MSHLIIYVWNCPSWARCLCNPEMSCAILCFIFPDPTASCLWHLEERSLETAPTRFARFARFGKTLTTVLSAVETTHKAAVVHFYLPGAEIRSRRRGRNVRGAIVASIPNTCRNEMCGGFSACSLTAKRGTNFILRLLCKIVISHWWGSHWFTHFYSLALWKYVFKQ